MKKRRVLKKKYFTILYYIMLLSFSLSFINYNKNDVLIDIILIIISITSFILIYNNIKYNKNI